jgi:hypothetical protein
MEATIWEVRMLLSPCDEKSAMTMPDETFSGIALLPEVSPG